MTKEQLYNYLGDPSLLSQETLPELEQLVDSYPYAGTLVFLYLYNLALLGDVRYQSELQRLAIQLPSRRLLYGLVEHHLPFEAGQTHLQPSGEMTLDAIDKFLREVAPDEPLSAELPYETINTSSSVDYFASELVAGEGDDPAASFARLIPQPTASPREEEKTYEKAVSKEPGDGEIEEELFTETLAKIHIQQQRYDKALEIFRSIVARYPQKSLYFAPQMRFLERLIANQKPNNNPQDNS